MIEFGWPLALLLLPLPYLVRRLMQPLRRDEAALRVPFFRQWQEIQSAERSHRSAQSGGATLLRMLSYLAWISLVLACTKPQWIGEAVQLPTSGRDLMLAVDISGSMKMEDMELNGDEVSRLTVVKSVLSEFIERRKGDRLGLILFGTQAYLQAPLTFDRNTVGKLLSESQIGFAGEKTAIGDAIGLAVKRLRSRPDSSRLLILLTDGANTAGEIAPDKAAELARSQSIKIHTIGVGASEMTRPGIFGSRFGARTFNPSADLDEAMLKQIAATTDGNYFRAHDVAELEQIYTLLDQLEPIEQESESFIPVRSLYIWPLGLALALCALIMLIRLYPLLRHQTTALAVGEVRDV